MSVPICNHFHTKRANNGKITFLGGSTPLDALIQGKPAHPGTRYSVTKNEKIWGSQRWRFRDLSLHRVDTAHECDRRTGRQTPRPWLRRAKHSAVARKNVDRVSIKQHGRLKLGVSWARNLTNSQTLCVGALSCSNMWKSIYSHRHVNAIALRVFTRDSRMLRASLPSSGRLSVCLSVTLAICIKTVQARITKSSLWTAPRSLVYRDKISCHWVQGFFSNEGVIEGYPLEKTSFCCYWLE